jgi:hypothetical protein
VEVIDGVGNESKDMIVDNINTTQITIPITCNRVNKSKTKANRLEIELKEASTLQTHIPMAVPVAIPHMALSRTHHRNGESSID